MSITKKIRFEVFKRDNFTCMYCGNSPPDIILELDHIQPKSKKGSDNINNIVTSCFDCNRGKSNNELKQIPNSLLDNYEILKEKEKQFKEYSALVNKIESRLLNECNNVNKIYSGYFKNVELTDRFLRVTVKMFIKKIGFIRVCEAMDKSCSIINDDNDSIKYFCGICWNVIKDGGYHE